VLLFVVAGRGLGDARALTALASRFRLCRNPLHGDGGGGRSGGVAIDAGETALAMLALTGETSSHGGGSPGDEAIVVYRAILDSITYWIL